ncbi:hypothetical protein LY28_03662 [Ruminiclostridium sufflavum DSM 19573]|uniref:DUF6385 domain-containing protein n=1 Tax=Ruminiclostridium sufflavum DSM 19573 TaxID=1121337 RepID=A0A318XFG3_9FIRM|nr:DUF6385 domain-containing protein [Ruminiclostridium sufflavum]PYG84298.1 hypothetical protein LY28_03662 [Ruminiclostridium sufflavum DSM 19573]
MISKTYLSLCMVLAGYGECGSDNIKIITEQGSCDNLSLSVECSKEVTVHVLPRFYEYKETLQAEPASEFLTAGVNISLMQKVSYFIKNTNSAIITVIAENSPDNVHYVKEIQKIFIPPGSSGLLVPINFSKFVRLSVNIPQEGNNSIIDTWLNMQQY